MKPLLLILFTLSILSPTAQTWQWGIRGGGFSNGLNIEPEEAVIDMATDRNGNLYTLSIIEASGNPTLGSSTLTMWGNRDILLASFKCDGTLRWKKVIGTSDNDEPTALSVDTLGNVFTVGNHWINVHVDTDSTFSNSQYKKIFIVNYDTSGNFKWIRHPSSDTSSITTNMTYTRIYDVSVDQAGNAAMFCHLTPQLLSGGGGHVITSAGYYLVVYNSLGNITAVTPLQMSGRASFLSIRMARTPGGKILLSGTIYLMGSPEPLVVTGQQINNPMFLFCFNSQGQLLWKEQNTATNSFSGFSYRPVLDTSGNIYLAGTTYPGDSFNGYTFTGTSGFPFVTRLDSNGNGTWLKQGVATGLSYGTGLTLANNKVYVMGDYPGRLTWDSYQYANPVNNDYDIFLTTFDAQTGNVMAIDSLQSDFGVYDFSSSITSDKFGNVYLGGGFGSQLPVGPNTLVNSGGYSDLFIAKYGSTNCSTVMPVSLLGFNATPQPKHVRCEWQTASEQNSSHFIIERSINGQQFSYLEKISAAGNSNTTRIYSYNDEDAYRQLSQKLYYRLRMVDKDGSYSYSKVVTVALQSAGSFVMAPNPSKGIAQLSYRFTPETNAINSLTVYNTAGVEVYSWRLSNEGTISLNLASQPPGVYFVQLRQNGGIVESKKLIISR